MELTKKKLGMYLTSAGAIALVFCELLEEILK